VTGNSLPNLLLFAFGLNPSENNTGATLDVEGGSLIQRGSVAISKEAVEESTEWSNGDGVLINPIFRSRLSLRGAQYFLVMQKLNACLL
tara:strand:- start:263 stop:529 length:267 start_codon:yes stop_codon:yes gene_type:complete